MEELTIAELIKQANELYKNRTEEIKRLAEQREKALKTEKYDEGAAEIKNMYDSYIRAGFNKAQAWILTVIIVSNSTKNTKFKEEN